MGYFDKLSDYYRSEQFNKDSKRFERQAKNTFLSTAIIIGAVFLLIALLVIYSVISSIF